MIDLVHLGVSVCTRAYPRVMCSLTDN